MTDVADVLLINPDTERDYFKRFKLGGLDELLCMNFVGSEALLDPEQLAELDANYAATPSRSTMRWCATHGYQGVRFARSFDTFDHVDCWNFLDLHDIIKPLKYGYGKVSDHACREIRHGRLTREQGAALALRHAGGPPSTLICSAHGWVLTLADCS